MLETPLEEHHRPKNISSNLIIIYVFGTTELLWFQVICIWLDELGGTKCQNNYLAMCSVSPKSNYPKFQWGSDFGDSFYNGLQGYMLNFRELRPAFLKLIPKKLLQEV